MCLFAGLSVFAILVAFRVVSGFLQSHSMCYLSRYFFKVYVGSIKATDASAASEVTVLVALHCLL